MNSFPLFRKPSNPSTGSSATGGWSRWSSLWEAPSACPTSSRTCASPRAENQPLTVNATVVRYGPLTLMAEALGWDGNREDFPLTNRDQYWWIRILSTGWWFGTFVIFPYIGNNHPNWLSCFSEGLKPPTRCIDVLFNIAILTWPMVIWMLNKDYFVLNGRDDWHGKNN